MAVMPLVRKDGVKSVTRQTPLRARPRKFRFPFTEEEKPAQFFIETKRVGRNKNAVMHSADK